MAWHGSGARKPLAHGIAMPIPHVLPQSRSNLPHGGHASSDLREAFESAFSGFPRVIPVNVFVRDQKIPVGKLCGILWNCRDVMPSSLCDCLDVPRGASYAQGARSAWRWLMTKAA